MRLSRAELQRIFNGIPAEKRNGVGLLSFYMVQHFGAPENLCGWIISPQEMQNFGGFAIYYMVHKPNPVLRYIGVNAYSENPEEILNYAIDRQETDVKIIRENGKLSVTTEKILAKMRDPVDELPTVFGQIGLGTSLILDESARDAAKKLTESVENMVDKLPKSVEGAFRKATENGK